MNVIEDFYIIVRVDVDLHPEVLEKALEIADGDWSRLQIKSDTEIIVHNNPF